MIRVNSLVPCIVLSILLHSITFFALFHRKNDQNVFMAVPFEVSFFSPVQQPVVEEVSEEISVPEPVPPVEKPKPEVKKPEKVKSEVVVKKKEKPEKKVEQKKVAEKPAEPAKDTATQTEQPKASGGNNYSSKGIMLENKSFKYSYYTNTIVKKISKYWQWSKTLSAYRAVVYFKIARDGMVYDVDVKESSGDTTFDQNAIRAVQLASPFAPLPEGYEENYLGVYFEFKFL
jgi:protein TonB